MKDFHNINLKLMLTLEQEIINNTTFWKIGILYASIYVK